MVRQSVEVKKGIGARIKKMRKALNFSQEKMSAHFGVVRPSYIKYERGEVFPGPGALYDLLTNFNISLNWLIGNKGSMYYKEEAQPVDPTGLQTVMASEEVRELLQHMERIPLLRHEVLSFFYKFKLDYKDLVDSSIKTGGGTPPLP